MAEIKGFLRSFVGTWFWGLTIFLVLAWPAMKALIFVLTIMLSVVYAITGNAPDNFEGVF